MVSGSHCDIGLRQIGTVTVVGVVGTLDSVTAPQLESAIADAVVDQALRARSTIDTVSGVSAGVVPNAVAPLS